MMSRMIIVLFSASLAYTAQAQSEFRPLAMDALSQIRTDLLNCGLSIQPFTPLNPNDSRRAIIVARNGRNLAWYGETGSFVSSAHEFRDFVTNGFVHRITYTNSGIRFQTPTRGTVAAISTYMYGLQRVYNFRCLGGYVPGINELKNCIYYDFMQPVVQQLCSA